MTKPNYVVYCTPEYTQASDGDWVLIRMRYFTTVKDTKKFAIKEAEKRQVHGYEYESLTRQDVASILHQHAPIPVHWRP